MHNEQQISLFNDVKELKQNFAGKVIINGNENSHVPNIVSASFIGWSIFLLYAPASA